MHTCSQEGIRNVEMVAKHHGQEKAFRKFPGSSTCLYVLGIGCYYRQYDLP